MLIMSFLESIAFFSDRLVQFSPELAEAVSSPSLAPAAWHSCTPDGLRQIDPIHFFMSIATASADAPLDIYVKAHKVPISRLVSAPDSVRRSVFVRAPGLELPMVIARGVVENDALLEIIDGESFMDWARSVGLAEVNVRAIPCTVAEAHILRVRLNTNRGRPLVGAGLVKSIVAALTSNPDLLARLTSNPKDEQHVTQRDVARQLFCLRSAASVNRALAILSGKSVGKKRDIEMDMALRTFRSMTQAAGRRDQRAVVDALIAHKRAIDTLLAQKLGVKVESLDSTLAVLKTPPSEPKL